MAKYVGAPYNFVPITKKIHKKYQSEEQLPRHNKMDTERYSGELQCRITAVTDLFIGGGDEVKAGEYSRFAHCLDGVPCIPGSSMKGLVRSNMQVLGFGSVAGDVEDYHIMYRQVGAAKSRVSDYYNDNILNVKSVILGKDKNDNEIKTTVPKNVKAGYIKKEGTSYVIYPTEVDFIDKQQFGECNYYPVSELAVFRAREEAQEQKKENPFSFFEEYGIQLQHDNNSKSSDFTPYDDRRGRKHIKGRQNWSYVPYIAKVLYQLNGNRKVTSIIKHDGICEEGYKEGYVISTGKMQEKKVFYVIPKIQEGDAIHIPESDILSFKRDYENKKNKIHGTLKEESLREKCRKFFALPEEGEEKPVFYVERGGRLYFGYTPFLRIFYEHSIMQGVSKEQREYMKENGDLKKPVLDYPSAILGYATDQSSYKSRVSFADFRLQIPAGKTLPQYLKEMQYKVELVQGEPKLSSYWDYLVQNHSDYAMTYNEDDFELRGIKQYWLHETVYKGDVKNEKTASRFQPLKKDVSFEGKVRFKNLSADELGLLIWSLSLETDSNQNIGRAKAFGYGRIDLEIEHLRLYDYEKMYQSPALCMNVFEEKDAEEINHFVEEYKDYMNRNYKKPGNGLNDIMKEKGIDALLKMKNSKKLPEEKLIAYMSLDNRDYQNRDVPLHSVDQVIGGKRPNAISGANGNKRFQNYGGRQSGGKYKNSGNRHSGGDYKDPKGEKNLIIGEKLKGLKFD